MTQTRRHLVPSTLLAAATVCLLLFVSSNAFSATLPTRQQALITRKQQNAFVISFANPVVLSARFNNDDDDDEDDREREYARVRRRRGGRAYYDDDDNEAGEAKYGRTSEDEDLQRSASNVGDYYDDDEEEYYDDDDDDEEVDDEYSMFGSAVIPNPLLDSIDPDGAAERFPELARDPKFWIDMLVFVAVLDFLSDIGPRNALPDIPYY